MQEKSTDDLKQELMEQADLSQYIQENEANFLKPDSRTDLLAFYRDSGLSKAELARRAGMSEVYLYQVFSGRRKPSRDRLICLCFGLGTSLDETQLLLKEMGYAPIYPRLKREAIISYGLLHHIPLTVINDKLFVENEKTLC